MNKIVTILFFISCLFNCKNVNPENTSTSPFNAQPVVMDYSKLFTDSQLDSLSNKIVAYERSFTNEIAIITQDSIPKNEDIQVYATRLGNRIGVGKKNTNNGLLIFVSTYDRKVAIATGLGTEKIITDSLCKVIIDSTMIPYFKKGNYYLGIDRALDSLISKWHQSK
ncbi:MAG: TPM domain-containing protein [Aquaticitalea sp.]